MSPRRAVLDVFDRLAFAAELLDDPRARVYTRAAWSLRRQTGDLAELFASGALAELDGIGKGMLAIIADALAGREPEKLTAMAAKLPAGVFEIRKIRGLGPKKAKALWKDLGITSLGELEYACRENRLVDLKGFGEKTQAAVLEQIAQARDVQGKLRRDRARAILESAIAMLGAERAEIAGDLRRGAELVEDLAIAVVGGASVELPASIRVVRTSSDAFGAALLFATGSREHVDALVGRARSRGLVLDETGLRNGERSISCPEESDVYAALDLVPTAPERREPGVVLVERGRATPRLVTRADLRGALHNHTIASDGAHTLEEMRAAAAARGLEYLGITEHSTSAFYAKGLSVDRLRAQIAEIEFMNGDGKSSCMLLTGVESDILEDGALDYEDDVLEELEVVVASAHKRHAGDRAAATARMVAAASSPRTAIVGHPTGRLLLARAPIDFDVSALLDACSNNNCAVELDSNPQRLDLSAAHVAMAKERGVLVSIAADAHRTDELDMLEHGVAVARRAGLCAEDVLNARGVSELREWLASRGR